MIYERYIFKQVNTSAERIGDNPGEMSITVEFNGECHIETVLRGFKDFLLGCSFSESLVERIKYIED